MRSSDFTVGGYNGGGEMNGGEKWSMVSYTGGSQDKTGMISSIMLGFRPIAPKPVAGESGSDGSQFDNKNLLLLKPRAKRKYVRVRKNNIRRKKRLSSDHEEASKNPEKIVTLQLLPEKTEANGSINSQHGAVLKENRDPPSLFNLNFNNLWVDRMGVIEEPDRMVVMSQKRRLTLVESWITVECVTDSCMEGRELGSTDVERMKNLDADTCPGFISDGLNRVLWVNRAYKKMLTVGEGNNDWLPSPSPEIMVWLVTKQELPRFSTVFSCKVRLQHTWQKEKCSKMLPCDVWKMDGGGSGDGLLAWRLDVEAALSLGR